MLPHANQPVVYAGAPLHDADAFMILVHGRNAAPKNILELIPRFDRPRVACAGPAAAGGTWYPNSFMAPRASNEPGLSSALFTLDALVESALARGFTSERILLLGFSQGACLALEYAARNARRYGGVLALSGGLIGPDDTPRDYPGSFDGTPVFLGCSDVDFHIPVERVHESADIMQRLGGDVTKRIYPGMGHTVNEDEMTFVGKLLARVSQG